MLSLSPITTQWDWLFLLYATIGSIVGGVVIGLFIYLCIRYRRRKEEEIKLGKIPPERGNIRVVYILTFIVTGILFTITLGTMQTVNLIEKPPEGTLVIEVYAYQWGWKFIYPNGKQLVGEVRVPKNEVVIFKVTSEDVFHNFGLIEFKVKADAIKGRVNTIWIKPYQTGEYSIQCFELCGVGHSWMKGKLLVMEPSEFMRWYGE